MLRSILCPIDFSEQSRHALRHAARLAARCHSRLTVLSVVDPVLAEAARTRFGQDLAKAETEPALREFVAATWSEPSAQLADTTFMTRIGDPAAVVLETANSEAVDLIVMGTQGLTGFRKWLLGSTTERVLRRTRLPVLAVPPARDDESFEISRILAATDFSESSVVAIKWAVQIAQQLSAALTLAHVVEPLIVPPQWRSLVEESDETRVSDSRLHLQRLAAQFCPSQDCETIVALGRPGDVISSIAEDRRVHLIVMGLLGDQGPFAPRPGSIAYRVLSSTAVPMLVVPASAVVTVSPLQREHFTERAQVDLS